MLFPVSEYNRGVYYGMKGAANDMGNSNLSIVYGILALMSALLFVSYFLFTQRKNKLFLALFGCVAAAWITTPTIISI